MNIKGKNIAILGAVRSGVSAAKLARNKGAIPFVSDISTTGLVKQNCEELKKLNIACEIGKHSEKIFESDFIITSPGVPTNATVLSEAKKRGINVHSEIEFASWFCEGNIIAITGTNGKTTATSLCSHILNQSGIKCFTAGNIGLPFSEIVEDVNISDYVALEVSSFQLDFISNFKPDFSIILNITPDHLDRYENRFDLYIKSKIRIAENQDKGDTFIYNGDDENIPMGYISERVQFLPFSLKQSLSNGCFLDDNWIVYTQNNYVQDICKVSELFLKGEHNLQNTMAVICVAKTIGLKNENIKKALGTFKGVEHRLEFIREVNGIKFINDSKATNVDSVWYALRSFEEPIYLILGGVDKGNDYLKIKDEVKNRVKKIYAIGESAETVHKFFNSIVDVEIVSDFNFIINKVLIETQPGSVLLLSPACASFDMFRNYEDRGSQFKEIVGNII
ncbi:MAG: UDP-N-acetylmuramoyl-L-alanine--D-glutamate ligase [Ignavibacteriae bacterium]|nr:MAG: UDP-N-acetylmuramoyl-L-alanine--D-glutamate ligase [Ignavibacteriota bacterium]